MDRSRRLRERGTISSADPVSPPTERMLGLSDALFGIAITFLALDFGTEPPTTADDVGGYLSDFSAKAGFDQYVELGDADADTLAKLADFVQRSICTQSMALGTGVTVGSLRF